MREKLLLDAPHRQIVFVIPKMLRIFFKYNSRELVQKILGWQHTGFHAHSQVRAITKNR